MRFDEEFERILREADEPAVFRGASENEQKKRAERNIQKVVRAIRAIFDFAGNTADAFERKHGSHERLPVTWVSEDPSMELTLSRSGSQGIIGLGRVSGGYYDTEHWVLPTLDVAEKVIDLIGLSWD